MAVSTPQQIDRPAFYALAPGGWRDLITILHVPYTAWNLAYVAIGASVAPHVHAARVAACVGAFALAVGISAHALDELNGRPLGTQLSHNALVALAVVALAGAVAIGIVAAVTISATLLPLVLVGAFLVAAYNLELFGGRFHSDIWFAASWGAFPALTGYWVNALSVRPAIVIVATACLFLSLAQRRLSTPVRQLRRRTATLAGTQVLTDGTEVALDRLTVAAPMEGALRACAAGVVALAVGLLCARL
jgi:hypothetical protein